MRVSLVLTLVAALMSVGSAHAQSYEAALRAVATDVAARLEEAQQRSATVFDFTDLQQQPTELGRLLAQELSDQLVNLSTKMAMVDRANLAFLLKEHKFTTEGLVNPETGRKLGKLIGIDAVIVGTTTPIGDQVRLSVRAISLESGKIVAARTATLTMPAQVTGMSNRGVAPGQESSGSPAKLTDRLRAGSFALSVGDFAVGTFDQRFGHTSKANFAISNASGIGVGLALQLGGSSAGPCTREYAAAGLPLLNDYDLHVVKNDQSPARRLRWVPPGAKVSGTLEFHVMECNVSVFRGVRTVPVSVSLVVATDSEVMTLPLTADNVTVRLLGN